MSKYTIREAEPLVAGSLIAAESAFNEARQSTHVDEQATPLDEARQNAYGPPHLKITDNTWWNGKPQAADIDRDGDGTADAQAVITYSMFGSVDKIQVTDVKTQKVDYTVQVNRDLFGMAYSMSVDLNNDGAAEQTLRPVRGWFSSKVKGISVDRDNDKKPDDMIRFKRAFFGGKIYSARIDKGNDGSIDQTIDLKRHWFSNRLSEFKASDE